MSTPGFGGRGTNPLDAAAGQAIGAMRASFDPRSYPRQPPPKLSDEERAEAAKAVQEGRGCKFCLGIHDMPGGPGCPRLATFKLDGDGKVVEGTFWPGVKWAKGRVVFTADAHEEPEGSDGEG